MKIAQISLYSSLLVLTFVSLLGALAYARGGGGMQMVPVGLGYSSPAVNTTLHGSENPAGLPSSRGTQLVLSGGSNSNSDTTAGGFINWGNGGFGAALGAVVATPSGGTSTTTIQGGLGGIISSLNTSLGVSGASTSSGTNPAAYLGFLINPSGAHRFALTNSASSTYGVGYSYVGSSFTLTLDATRVTNGTTLGPGILFDGGSFQFALTQIIHSDTTTSTSTNTTRVAFAFGSPNFMLGFYYNYISTYAAALTLAF